MKKTFFLLIDVFLFFCAWNVYADDPSSTSIREVTFPLLMLK